MTERRHWLFDRSRKVRVDMVNMGDAWLALGTLDMIVKSGVLKNPAVVVDPTDHQRGLVWLEGRCTRLLESNLYAYRHRVREVRVEVIDARQVRFTHEDLKIVTNTHMVKQMLDKYVSTNCRKCGTTIEHGRQLHSMFVELSRPNRIAGYRINDAVRLAQTALRGAQRRRERRQEQSMQDET